MTYTLTQGETTVALNLPIDIKKNHTDDVQMQHWRDDSYGAGYFGNLGESITIIGEERSPPCVDFDGEEDCIDSITGYYASGQFTFCFWAKASDWTERGLIGHETNVAGGYIAAETASKIEIRTSVYIVDANLTESLPTDQWVHLAITRDGSNYYKVYKNGVDISGTTQASGYILMNRLFNVPDDSTWDGFYGQIRDVRLFTVAKTAAQITSIMNGNEDSTNLQAWWKLNKYDADDPLYVYEETGTYESYLSGGEWSGTILDMHIIESMQGNTITIAGFDDTNLNGDYLLQKIRCKAVKGKVYCYEYEFTLETKPT